MSSSLESDSIDPQPSRRSTGALDALAFFLADVQDGLGPYLAIYLTSHRGWAPSDVGVAMSAVVVGTLVAQLPAGSFIDRTRYKTLAVSVAALVVAVCCIAMVVTPTLPVIVTSQVVIGAAASLMPPALAAVSLGLCGRRRLAGRIGRNEAFNHAGNVFAAALAGAAGTWLGYESIFLMVAATATASAVSASLIRSGEIDHRRAREAVPAQATAASIRTVLSDGRLLAFLAAVFAFHFANAAMLPLVGQKVAADRPDAAAALMSACIITAQLVMIPAAIVAARSADAWGPNRIFLIGFIVLPIRGLLYLGSTSAAYLIGVQILDGIGAGIYGVVGVLIVADLVRGTGRFNLALGAMAMAAGLGAAASNFATGFVIEKYGYNGGFLCLAGVAVGGLAWFATMFRPRERRCATLV